MEAQSPAGIDLRRILTVLRRHVIMIVVLTLVAAGAAYAYAASKTPMYTATAQMLYTPQLNVNDPLNQNYTDPTVQQLDMQSAVTMLTGPVISRRVADKLGGRSTWPPHDVSAAVTTSDAQATRATDNGVSVTVDSVDPKWAAKLANAYADEFVAYRLETYQQSLKAAEAVISRKLEAYKTDAQKASTDYVMLSGRLSDLEILSATATSSFSVAVPASTPSAPFSPKPLRSAVIGGFAGFVIAVGLALLRERLDTRLHDYTEIREIMDLPVIARIGKIPQEAMAKGPLVVATEAEGRAAEAIRVLRSSLQFAALGEENKVLMIVSAQKGEGKSLITANLAVSLALSGKSVVLVDADLRRPKVHDLLHLRNTSGVSSVIAGFSTLQDALQSYTPLAAPVVTMGGNGGGRTGGQPTVLNTGMQVLTSGPIPPNPGEMVSSKRFAAMIEELVSQGFDYVLIDSPAFLAVGDAAALAGVADGVLLLVNMRMTKKPDLEEAREFLSTLPPAKLGVVTVMDSTVNGERYHYYAHR